MYTNKYSGDDIGFLDIVQNMSVFFFLVVVALMGFVSITKLEDVKIESNAEFAITVEWAYEDDCDVDTYLMNPNKQYVYFSQKEQGLLNLDRDDRGSLNDTFMIGGERYEFKHNKEIATIRGIVPGEYILNVHMFNKRAIEGPVEVKVIITKLNPKVSICYVREVFLRQNGEEAHICRFKLTENGSLIDIRTDLPFKFIGNPALGNLQP